jgi:hypothetical protein
VGGWGRWGDTGGGGVVKGGGRDGAWGEEGGGVQPYACGHSIRFQTTFAVAVASHFGSSTQVLMMVPGSKSSYQPSSLLLILSTAMSK